MCKVSGDYTAAAERELEREYEPDRGRSMIKSDGNGSIILHKGLVYVIGIALPVLFSVFGFGVSQIIGIAEIEARVAQNEQHIEELRQWGPQSGDRYSATDARSDWRVHETVHIALLAEFTEIKVRLAAIEQAIKK